MKTKLTLKVATALLALSTLNSQLSTCFAQGTAFTYQGRLTSGTNVANGIYDLRLQRRTDGDRRHNMKNQKSEIRMTESREAGRNPNDGARRSRRFPARFRLSVGIFPARFAFGRRCGMNAAHLLLLSTILHQASSSFAQGTAHLSGPARPPARC